MSDVEIAVALPDLVIFAEFEFIFPGLFVTVPTTTLAAGKHRVKSDSIKWTNTLKICLYISPYD